MIAHAGVPRQPRARHAVATFLDGCGDLRALELLRIAAGPIVILHLWPFLERSLDGIAYSDRFHQPYVAWYPEAPRELYFALLWLAVPAAVALSAGAATRFASGYLAAFVAYNLFLSQTHFVHNRAFLTIFLIGLAILPVGRRASVDAWRRQRRGQAPLSSVGRLWPILLLRFEVVMVFFASGWSKLIDPDWWNGTVLILRFADGREAAAARGVPDWLLDIIVTESFNSGFAKVAVLTELAIALGLIFRRTRLAALWIEVGFHVSIEVVFSVQVFSYIALAAMVIWVTPSALDREITLRGSTRGATLIGWAARWLDWTGRFTVTNAGEEGAAITLADRDGSKSNGGTAALAILTRLPATFWFAAPLHGLNLAHRRLRRAGSLAE